MIIILLSAAHVSLMMPMEYGSISKTRLEKIHQVWKNKRIKFHISGVDMELHKDPFGEKQWVILLRIISEELNTLRNQMGIQYTPMYRSHIAILEKDA